MPTASISGAKKALGEPSFDGARKNRKLVYKAHFFVVERRDCAHTSSAACALAASDTDMSGSEPLPKVEPAKLCPLHGNACYMIDRVISDSSPRDEDLFLDGQNATRAQPGVWETHSPPGERLLVRSRTTSLDKRKICGRVMQGIPSPPSDPMPSPSVPAMITRNCRCANQTERRASPCDATSAVLIYSEIGRGCATLMLQERFQSAVLPHEPSTRTSLPLRSVCAKGKIVCSPSWTTDMSSWRTETGRKVRPPHLPKTL